MASTDQRKPRRFTLPLLKFLKGYRKKDFLSDTKAGANVALLDFPQGMAYAMIAGLPVNFGIYSSAIGSLTGPLLGSSRFLMLGPTNASAVLLLSGFLSLDWPEATRIAAMPLLLLMIGAIMVVGAMARADIVIRYVSRSVVTGYVSAAALLIIVNQLKPALGIDAPRAATFLDSLIVTFEHIGSFSPASLGLSVGTIIVALAFKRWFRVVPYVAVTLALAASAAWYLPRFGISFPSLDSVPVGSWPISIPRFNWDQMHDLLGVAFAIAFLSLLESASIAKSLASQAGDTVDIRQQMISMGVADTVNAFGSGMPVSGSLTRSTLNYASGAKSPISSMISGAILVVGALLLGPIIGYIPKAALAALVILVGVSLIRPATIKALVKATKSDCTTFLITFFSGLVFPLDTAIYAGVAVSVMLFLKKASTPDLVEYGFNERGELTEKKHDDETAAISIMHVEGDLFFGSTDVFEEQLRQLVVIPEIKVIILRLKNARHLDATGALAIGDFVKQARLRGVEVVVSGAMPEIMRVLTNTGVSEILGAENLMEFTPDNITLSTRNALKRAQNLLGVESAEIMLFGRKTIEE
ncbi:SulP family inorganic anion transporter [Pelagicoccus sp. SDUM812002]|uniref:SulP family inorganic anion transporter n=1 Tax=Pelagicoccus sp. SDUM812002 TaxID=3041266 RepID=UPI00281000A8|nr:SulP family inorganic anion transporter [Pelagicoccus sp. SDUM812002]MDQ8188309.1 SulP family inorganic anion transporter [Pelagicoccus sp. SDUM812002]